VNRSLAVCPTPSMSDAKKDKKDNEDLNAPMNALNLQDPGSDDEAGAPDPGSDDEAGAPDPALVPDPAGFKSIGKPRYKMTYRPLLVFLVFMMLSVTPIWLYFGQ